MSLRLSKDGGNLVLCPVLSCGSEVGHMDGRTFVLMAGYRRDGDVFRMTPHALGRIRGGAAPRRYGGQTRDNPNDQIPMEMAGIAPCCLPVKVECWSLRCGRWITDADPDVLDADPRRHDGDAHHDQTVAVPRERVVRPEGPPQRRRPPNLG